MWLNRLCKCFSSKFTPLSLTSLTPEIFTNLRISKTIIIFVALSNMIVIFEKKYLKELYEIGKTSDKKHRFQPSIVKRYKDRIKYLIAATSKEGLYPIKSLHFEALHGDKKGLFSIKVNDQYRIEFSMTENIDEPILTICNIVELSNHYD